MAYDTSYIVITGRMVADPVVYANPNKNTVIRFSVASSRGKGRDTSFFDVVAFGALADKIAAIKGYAKGVRVLVRGNMNQETWTTKEGQKRKKYVIVLETYPQFLEFKLKENDPETFSDAVFSDPDFEELDF